jgi:hypothetical protein
MVGVLLILRASFITIQSLYMIYSMSRVPSRYYNTYDTLLQFEIWFSVLCCIMMLLLFPNYVFFNNVNYLMTVLVINSF